MFSLLETAQRRCAVVPFRITVSGGTPTVAEGGSFLDITDNGAGDFSLAFSSRIGASARTPVVFAMAESDSTTNEYVVNSVTASLSTSGFRLIVNDDAGTATDNINISGFVAWFGTADAI